MILPPFSAPQQFKNSLQPSGTKERLWFIFSKNQLLVGNGQNSLPKEPHQELDSTLYIGLLNGIDLFAGRIEKCDNTPPDYLWISLRSLHATLDKDLFAIAGRALQLLHWHRTHKYCGCCGNSTFARKEERCLECSKCGHLSYPKLAPAILALVRKGNQILLARNPLFDKPIYSVIAGFVEPGETSEQCVAREVLEETNIQVKNISYFASQPWPFSQSLMLGFICEWAAGEIQIDPTELEEANWFDLSELPPLPQELSLSRFLINHLLQEVKI